MAKTGLVVSAHPGDFVWRAGGAIALHAKKGYRVKIVCLAFGERGESQFAWKQPGMTLDKVKAGRKDEAERAAFAASPDDHGDVVALNLGGEERGEGALVLDDGTAQPGPQHENLRGPHYYDPPSRLVQ